MKKQFEKYQVLLVAVVFLTMLVGCTVKTYSVMKERPDQEEEGNKGMLTGDVPEGTGEKDTRKTYVMEVEFGQKTVDSPVVREVVEEEAEEVVEDVFEDVVFIADKEIVYEEVDEVVEEPAEEVMDEVVVGEVIEEAEEVQIPMK